jgi:hypothetical protein
VPLISLAFDGLSFPGLLDQYERENAIVKPDKINGRNFNLFIEIKKNCSYYYFILFC